jgi:hypothetical protein
VQVQVQVQLVCTLAPPPLLPPCSSLSGMMTISPAGWPSRAPPPPAFSYFTGPATSRLLLLTDAGHDAVHIIDAVHVIVVYVAAPCTI